MKKKLSFIFVLIAMFLFSACGEEHNKPTPIEETKYKVTFVALDEVLDVQEVESGKSATAPSVNIEGYIFNGWDKDFSNVTSDLTVNALLTEEEVEIKYIVRFLVDGKEIDKQEIKENEAAIAPSDPTKEGYKFVGWDKDFSKISSDLDINALFEEEVVTNDKYYTVEFVVEGEVINSQQVKEGESAILPDQPEPVNGKYFGGWRKDTSNVTSDMRVVAIMSAVKLEGAAARIPLTIGKANLTYYATQAQMSAKIYDASLYTTQTYFCEGYPSGTVWWYRILIDVVNGNLEVVEVVDRGKSSELSKCDYCIFAYTDALSKNLSDTGVAVGDIIQFSTHPQSFFESGEVKESFIVKRLTDVIQYDFRNDVSHTVIALNELQKKFDAMGIIREDIELPTYDDVTKSSISWESSNPSVLNENGEIGEVSTNTTITLKATATYESSTYYWIYEVTVAPIE